MAIRIRRGTDAQRAAVTFLDGEIVWTTDLLQFWVGDGVTAGGILIGPGGVGIISVNGDLGPIVTLTVVNSGIAGLLQWSGTQLEIPQADTDTTGLLSDTDWDTFNNKQPAGNYITALTGDVTAAGPGSVAATIANNAVTFAKMQDLSGPSILVGRYSIGVGDPQEITLGTGISMDAFGVLSATGTGGTVTSVGLSLPAEFTIAGSPVVGAGTLTGTWANATAGYVFAGPAGAVPPGTPSFRALAVSDFPTMTSAQFAAIITDETGTAGSVVFSASPTFTGNPLAPTQAPNTNNTTIATTAYVDTALAGAGGYRRTFLLMGA